jgi:hypothetical protein
VKTNQYLTENIDYKYNIVHQWMKCDHTNEICTPLKGLPQGIKVNCFLYDVIEKACKPWVHFKAPWIETTRLCKSFSS